jgi:hypothetical protein
MPREPDGGHRVSDRQDEQRWKASVESWSATPAQDDAPRTGWRRFVHKATGGAYNPGSGTGLHWLIAHDHEELVARSVPVISSVRPNTGDVGMQVLRDYFAARCRAVIEISYDAHLVTGGLIDLERIAPSTRQAYLELAAAVAAGFALPPLQPKLGAQA